MITHDLPAEDLVQVVLQRRQGLGQLFQLGKGNRAHLAIFQGKGAAGVQVAADGIQPEDLPGHLEPGDLFTTVHRQHAGLEEPQAHRVQRVQGIAGAIQRVAFLHPDPLQDQGVQAFDLLVAEAQGQTQFQNAAT